MSAKTELQLIQERAYELSQSGNGQSDFDNWLQAEKEVRAELKKKDKAAAKPTADEAKKAAPVKTAAPAPKVEPKAEPKAAVASKAPAKAEPEPVKKAAAKKK